MRLVRCPSCGFVCKKDGKTNAGSQRWYCNQCSAYRTKSVCKNPYNTRYLLVL